MLVLGITLLLNAFLESLKQCQIRVYMYSKRMKVIVGNAGCVGYASVLFFSFFRLA